MTTASSAQYEAAFVDVLARRCKSAHSVELQQLLLFRARSKDAEAASRPPQVLS
jgi:hypothetical protein